MSDTSVLRGARLGNLVIVGHSVTIESEAAISSKASIAGDLRIGRGRSTAAVINSTIKIGDHSMVGLGSVVTKSVPERVSVFGNPARPLPTMRKF